MAASVTLEGWTVRRTALLVAALAMAAVSALGLHTFFNANYPAGAAGVFCDISPLFNCSAFATSPAASALGVPVAWDGLVVAALLALGALFPSAAFERTLRLLATLNALAATALAAYAAVQLRVLPPFLLAYTLLSAVTAALFLRARDGGFAPSPRHLLAMLAVGLLGAWGLAAHHRAVRAAWEAAVSSRVVNQFFALPQVELPSEISPYWTVRSTADFEAAPIRIVEYACPLCVDCQVMYAQIKALESEFEGRINVAFQFFPLEAACNDVVEKDLHPGACDLTYMLAYDAAKFRAMHDEIFDDMQAAKQPEWRAALAKKYGVEAALTDPAVRERVARLVATGTEYEKTSDKYAHGIRSTPTLIINNRMVIGTLPIEHLRAIFRALVDAHETGNAKFMENWVDSGCSIGGEGPPKPCGL